MATDNDYPRFAALLKVMTDLNAQSQLSTRPTSNPETDGDCDETQTSPDISEGACRRHR